jgi:predicted nucleic acid-binding protein
MRKDDRRNGVCTDHTAEQGGHSGLRLLRSLYGAGLIGDIDALIAATALERNLTVDTADGDFERVPGLQVKLVSVT